MRNFFQYHTKKEKQMKNKTQTQEYCQGSWEIVLDRGVANNMLFSLEISSAGIQQYTITLMLNQCVQWKDILIMLCIRLSMYRNVNAEYGIIFWRTLLYPVLLLIFIPLVTDSARCSFFQRQEISLFSFIYENWSWSIEPNQNHSCNSYIQNFQLEVSNFLLFSVKKQFVVRNINVSMQVFN